MKNIVFRLLGAVALLLCSISIYAEKGWVLVSDVKTLNTGDQVIIVSNDYACAMGINPSSNGNQRSAVTVELKDNICIIDANVQILDVTLNTDGTFYLRSGNSYLSADKDNNCLYLSSKSAGYSNWNIEITEGVTKLKAKKGLSNLLQYYRSSNYFNCYSYEGDGKYHVSLYEYTEYVPEEKVQATIAFIENGIVWEEESFIGASLSLPAEASVFDGLEFMGWSREPIVAGVAVADDAIRSPGTSVSVEADMTFYAVYAKPIESGEPAYIKVNSEQEDWSGTYLIACESSSKVFNSSLGKNDLFAEDVSNAVDITIVDGKIALTETNEQYEFVIAKYNDGYSIKSKNGYYIGYKYDGTYVIQTTPYLNIIEIKKDLLEIRSSGYWLFYNNNKSQFIYTTSENVRVQLYKRVETIKSYAFYTTSPNTEIRINKYGYSTWYSGMPVTVPAGMKAYYCTTEGNTVLLNNMGDIIPANTGAVLYAESAINKEGGESFTLAYSNKDASDFTGNQLIGYVQDTEVNNSNAHYALNVHNDIIGFYIPQTATADNPTATSAFIAKAGKAYLELPQSTSATSYTIRRLDDTTIDQLNEESYREASICDLMGRKVKNPTKGIYIINGRKVVL